MNKRKRVLIMAGGTGGHVFPGLAVAKLLQIYQIEVYWLGTRAGLEAQLVPKENIPLYFISIKGLRGKGWKKWMQAPWWLMLGFLQAFRVIRTIQPDVVLGMGGFVSGPGGGASYLLRKKLIIHEQNAKPGLTNQWLAKIAAKVLQAFPNTFTQTTHAITVGNPLRQEISTFVLPADRFLPRQRRLHLLVMGGSLGAEAINTVLPAALASLPDHLRPAIWHLTGEKHYATTLKTYEGHGVEAEVTPFTLEMEKAYSWADMVLCRSGALTVTELCAVGLGAIFVPYPYSVDDHQTANANVMVKNQAAFLLKQTDLTVDILVPLLKELSASKEKCSELAKAAYALRQIGAAEKILNICKEMCH